MPRGTGRRRQGLGPWPDVATARLFLASLAGLPLKKTIDWAARCDDPACLGEWLVSQELGPLAYYHFQKTWPALATCLRVDAFNAIAENSLRCDRLAQISLAFGQADLQFVLLKGAALAYVSYPDPALRTMSDIDIWVWPADMVRAYQVMMALGFKAVGNPDRPPKLQQLYQGEIQCYDEQDDLVELHWAPVSGWQLQNTAVIDVEAVWSRTTTFEINSASRLAGARTLAVEDMIIQLALHTGINHRFRLAAVRSFIDIARTALTKDVDWVVVAERAKRWRVATAVWCTLDLVQTLVGVPGMERALDLLRPSRLRRFLIRRFVSAESILAGDARLGEPMQNNPMGYLFLLFLIDRPADALRLMGQAVWPEKAWLQARYGEGVGRWHHIRHLLRRGRI